MIITQQIKIHLDKRFLETPTVEAVQGESTRAVEFQLYSSGAEWTVPDGTTATVRYRIFHEGACYGSTYDALPDGSPACIADGSKLTVYLPTEVLSIWGVGELQIGLFNGDTAIALFSVLLRVQQDFSFDGASPAVHQDVSAQIQSAVNRWADRNYAGGVTANDLTELRKDTEALIAEELTKHGQLKPEFANSVGECTDTSKLYVLPDGYIYAYMTTSVTPQPPELFDRNACTLNARYSGTPGTEKAANGYYITDFIPVDMSISDPVVLRFKGGKLWSASGDKLMLLDADKNVLDTTYIYSDESSGTALHHQVYADGDDYCIDLGYVATTDALAKHSSYDQIAYIRINQCINSSGTEVTADHIPNVSITIDAMGGTAAEGGWLNTGHAFVPADYESRIVALEEQTAKLEGKESITDAVPSYWQEAVDTAVSKVKVLQDQGGNDVVNFLWFSDMHYAAGNRYVANLGLLCAAIMNACDIPLTVNSGDTMSAGIASTEDQLLNWLGGAMDILSPIGPAHLLAVRGNHDDVYGSYTNGNTTSYYVNKASSNRVWNVLHRGQATDFRRVFGGNGTYFYIDNAPQKVRFVCLNSHYYDGEGYTDGTSSAMTSGFGADQLAWLRNTALTVGDGWSVVIVTHVPPTAQAVNGNTYYLSQISDGEDFRTIIAETTADVIGIFCGHCHADAVVTDDLPCPIVTITSAINTPYDGTAANRVLGTATETALDVVSINKASRTIEITRLGAGTDRTVNY